MASGTLPDHKLIPQTGFIVDGFKYKNPIIKAYFLSHAHGGKSLQASIAGSFVSSNIIKKLGFDSFTD